MSNIEIFLVIAGALIVGAGVGLIWLYSSRRAASKLIARRIERLARRMTNDKSVRMPSGSVDMFQGSPDDDDDDDNVMANVLPFVPDSDHSPSHSHVSSSVDSHSSSHDTNSHGSFSDHGSSFGGDTYGGGGHDSGGGHDGGGGGFDGGGGGHH